MALNPAERFSKCVEYLDACYEAWKAVFDNYDALLRAFRSLSPNMSDELMEMLKELKRQIEDKKEELERTWEDNLKRVQAGANVQETPPLALKIDFNFTKLLKAAWPMAAPVPVPVPVPQPIVQNPVAMAPQLLGPIAPPVPFQQPPIIAPPIQQVQIPLQPSAPPGFDFGNALFGGVTGQDRNAQGRNSQDQNGQDRVLSWVQSSAPPPPKVSHPKAPAPVEPVAKTLLDDDDFETFGNVEQQQAEEELEEAPVVEPMKRVHLLCDLDDFDTFGGEPSVPAPPPPPPPRPMEYAVSGFVVPPSKATHGSPSSSKTGSQSTGTPTLPRGDPVPVLETMRSIDFLTNKIKQKYGGEQQPTPLSKVYGHLSQEEKYREVIGGGSLFAEFLGRFPDYFRLTADRSAVFLTRDACRKSAEAVKLAEKQVTDWQRAQKKQPAPSKKPTEGATGPAVALPKKTAAPKLPSPNDNGKPSLMDMDDYGDSHTESTPEAAGDDENEILDDDEFDEFGDGSNNENAKPPQSQPRQPVNVVQQVANPLVKTQSSGSRQPMAYWDIVEMVVKRLELAEKYETYDVGKQVAVEAVKIAMQGYTSSNFGQLDPDVIADKVKDFIPKGAEAVKRKQQRPAEEATSAAPGISDKQMAEWKYKTLLCSDYAANSQCPRGDKCGFAHGLDDVRPKRRVKICSSFNAGTCRKSADDCPNAHGPKYLGTLMPKSANMTANISVAKETTQQSAVQPKVLAPAPAPSKSYWKGTSSAAGGSANFQDTDPTCSICFEPMKDAAAFRLPCGHRFHKKCFEDWRAKGQSTCPKCRIAIVDEVEYPSL